MNLYYDTKKGLGSAYKIFKGQDKLKYDQVKELLKNQEPYQLNKQGTTTRYFPIVGHGIGSYQADLMFLNIDKKYSSVLCIINVITRVAYAYPQKSKSDTSSNLAKWLKELPEGIKVRFIQTDNGSEFLNRKVKAIFDEANIEHTTAIPGDHHGQGKIERFNGTLRRLITLYKSAYKTTKWFDVLPDLMYNYNHRYHRAIKMAPIEADEVTQFNQEIGKQNDAQKQLDEFSEGDQIRVLKPKGLFDKGRKVWSNDTYKIDSIQGRLLHVLGKGWKKHYEIQKVVRVHKKLFDDNEAVDTDAIKKTAKVARDLKSSGVDKANIIVGKDRKSVV